MNGNCAVCGSKLEDNIKFCPDCGEKIQSEKPIEEKQTKNENKNQKTNSFFKKISIKNIPKQFLVGFVLICIAIIAIASVFIFSPFDLSGSVINSEKNISDQLLLIDVENNCDESAKCYLAVNGLKYIYFGNNGDFTIKSGESMVVSIVEDVLFKKCDCYEISLFVDLDHVEKITVKDVYESADFSINPLDLEGEFSIESNNVR